MLNAKAAVYVEVTQTSEKALTINIENKNINKICRLKTIIGISFFI